RRHARIRLAVQPPRPARRRPDREGGRRAPRAGLRRRPGRARGGDRSMSDEIVLSLPRDPRFYDIAHLVLGGLGARADLTLDHLDDLHLALDGLLPRDGDDREVTVV